MKAEDLQGKTVDELNQALLHLRKEQFNYRFQASQGTLGNPSLMRKVRRDIARVKTFLTRKRAEEKAAQDKKAT